MAPTIETSLDILTIVLEYACGDGAETARSVLLVNRLFRLVAQSLAHRHHVLHFPEFAQSWATVVNKHPWLDHDSVVPHIQYLVIDGSTDRPPALQTWTLLETILQKINHLRALSYKLNQPPPIELLDSLARHHPRAQLRIFSYNRGDMTTGTNNPAETALLSTPTLTSISCHLRPDWQDRSVDLREAAIRRIISRSPNLKFVSITKSANRGVRRPDYPLEELRRQEEPFLAGLEPSTSVRHLTLNGYGSTKETLEDWGQVVSLSSLESLKCFGGGYPHPSFFNAASQMLSNLKRLNANFAYCNDWPELAAAVEQYLTTCNPLQHISLWSWRNFAPLDAILQHGPTLLSLELHEREDNDREPMSLEEIKQIRDRCPKLQDLAIDLRRETRDGSNEVHNPRKYAEIAKIPKLQRLQIYFDLGLAWEMYDHGDEDSDDDDDGEDDGEDGAEDGADDKLAGDENDGNHHPLPPTGSVLAKPIVEGLWRQIFGTRLSGVRQLDVKYGEFERGFAPRLWEKENKMQWQVLPNERDDMRTEPVLYLLKVPEPERFDVKPGRQD